MQKFVAAVLSLMGIGAVILFSVGIHHTNHKAWRTEDLLAILVCSAFEIFGSVFALLHIREEKCYIAKVMTGLIIMFAGVGLLALASLQ